MGADDDATEVVTSVGALDVTVVLLRDFLHRSGALRVVALVEPASAGQPPAVVECGRFTPVEVDLGSRVVQLPHDLELDAVAPVLPGLRQLPPFDVDALHGEVTGTIGGLEYVADAVRSLAAALGGQNVAMAVFETTDAQTPLAITARADDSEPVIVAFGGDEYELPDARSAS